MAVDDAHRVHGGADGLDFGDEVGPALAEALFLELDGDERAHELEQPGVEALALRRHRVVRHDDHELLLHDVAEFHEFGDELR